MESSTVMESFYLFIGFPLNQIVLPRNPRIASRFVYTSQFVGIRDDASFMQAQ